MPVCARCGEIAARCTCVTARSAATTPLLEGHRDRWTTRYNSPTLQVDDQLFAGSILDKASGDHRCASCERAFIADETLFPWQDTLLCRSCFARDHSKGVCEACGRQVLDGSFTQAEERIWHSTCYRCVYCRSVRLCFLMLFDARRPSMSVSIKLASRHAATASTRRRTRMARRSSRRRARLQSKSCGTSSPRMVSSRSSQLKDALSSPSSLLNQHRQQRPVPAALARSAQTSSTCRQVLASMPSASSAASARS